MTTTELFFKKAERYQNERAKLTEEHEKKLKSIERYKGSQGYTDEFEKAKEEYKKALKKLQNEYQSSFDLVLDTMSDKIATRKVEAPTSEQINILNALKLSEKLTPEMLDRAAESMNGNPLGISIVQDLANFNGILRSYGSLAKEMSTAEANRTLDSIKKWVYSIL